jgi:hypothetical protein
MVLTGLEHKYLAEKGFPNAQRMFSNSSIPLPVKADAFMHGFVMVILVLLGISILVALLSALRKARPAGVIDHEVSGAAVLSSGFMSGFRQETAGLTIFVTALPFRPRAGCALKDIFMAGRPKPGP